MSAFRVVVCAVLLSAGVAAVVAAAMARLAADTSPRIGGVRLTDLTIQYLAQAARDGRTDEETAEAARAWAAQLETALDRVAAARGIVLVPAEAVVSGAPDYTGEVEATMESIAASAAPEWQVAPDAAIPQWQP